MAVRFPIENSACQKNNASCNILLAVTFETFTTIKPSFHKKLRLSMLTTSHLQQPSCKSCQILQRLVDGEKFAQFQRASHPKSSLLIFRKSAPAPHSHSKAKVADRLRRMSKNYFLE